MRGIKQSTRTDCSSRRLWLQQFSAMTFGAACAASPLALAANGVVSVKANARRIVSIGGALTEILYALQAQSELVAVDTTSSFPDAAQKLPNVGYARSLSTEGVLAMAPTMILATEDAGPPGVIRQLTASGIPVNIVAANHRFQGLLDRVSRIGDLTGRAATASKLVQQLESEWQSVQTMLKNHKERRALFILSHSASQIMVAGKDTSAQAMMDYACITNAVDGFSGYKPLTPEAVIAAKPDIILVTDQGLNAVGGVDGILKMPGLSRTPAGQKSRSFHLKRCICWGSVHACLPLLLRSIMRWIRH